MLMLLLLWLFLLLLLLSVTLLALSSVVGVFLFNRIQNIWTRGSVGQLINKIHHREQLKNFSTSYTFCYSALQQHPTCQIFCVLKPRALCEEYIVAPLAARGASKALRIWCQRGRLMSPSCWWRHTRRSPLPRRCQTVREKLRRPSGVFLQMRRDVNKSIPIPPPIPCRPVNKNTFARRWKENGAHSYSGSVSKQTNAPFSPHSVSVYSCFCLYSKWDIPMRGAD